MFGKLWKTFSYGMMGWSLYKNLTAATEVKNEFYAQLSPEQQREWDNIWGNPQLPTVPGVQLPPARTFKPTSDVSAVNAGV